MGKTLLPYDLPQEEKSFLHSWNAGGSCCWFSAWLRQAAAARYSVALLSSGSAGVWCFLLVACQPHSASLRATVLLKCLWGLRGWVEPVLPACPVSGVSGSGKTSDNWPAGRGAEQCWMVGAPGEGALEPGHTAAGGAGRRSVLTC